MTEEEVKLNYITPAIENAGWERKRIRMEYSITKGKIIVRGKKVFREKAKRADYLLTYKDNIPLAVVEAKDDSHNLGDGMQQAMEYCDKLNVRFAFDSNGSGFLFYDMKTGEQKTLTLDEFPSPESLYQKIYGAPEVTEGEKKVVDYPYYFGEGTHEPRYYQRIAINKTVDAIASGKDRALLVMATGTGKTYTAFQIIWRLYTAGIKKKILYLADRNILIDQTIIGDFKPFKNKMKKIDFHKMKPEEMTAYEIYLSLYQQMSKKGADPLSYLKENFKHDFFDLIIVDECHRGSARADSNWRAILDYFDTAAKIGMTATPKETNEVSNIDYFGEPIYTYSLKDGIEDGFLAPYIVHRYAIDTDVFGYRPEEGQLDDNGEEIEDKEYGINDFDRTIVIDERTKLVAKYITDFLKSTDRFQKTIVFCVDIEHAERMRQALIELNGDLMAENHNYIMRITGDNPEGKNKLDYFIDDNEKYPTIVTTSKLLTTGVNCKTCKVIVLDNIFGENGMTEFKQIIGRGSRIKEEYNKLYFTILDFRNATTRFDDPDFNGPVTQVDDYPKKPKEPKGDIDQPEPEDDPDDIIIDGDDWIPVPPVTPPTGNKKLYVSGVPVEMLSERVRYYDKDGKLVTESFTDYTRKNILAQFATLEDFLQLWTSDEKRSVIIEELKEQGIVLEEIRKLYPANVDDFDLICDIAYGVTPITKHDRASRKEVKKILDGYSDKCRIILQTLLDKYSDGYVNDFTDPKVLKLKEFQEFGSQLKIASLFGGKDFYFAAVKDMQKALYI